MYKILKNTIEMDDYSIQRLSSRVSQYLWYKLWGNTRQGVLPTGYTQVDYIESNGTQYIDTEVIANNNSRLFVDFQLTQIDTSRGIAGQFFTNNKRFQIYQSGTLNTITLGIGDANATVPSSLDRYKITLDAINLKAYVNNEDVSSSSYTRNISGNNSIYLFSSNQVSLTCSSMKLYNSKIWNNDVLVRDFIPCYRNSDNEVGLYDLVNNVFYTNQGTDSFTYGSVAPTPSTPIEVKGVGEKTGNLFNETWESGSIGNTGGNLNDTNAIRTVGFIACEAKKLYSFSPELDVTETWVNYYDNNGGISRFKITDGTFTTPQGCTRLRFRLSRTDIGITPVSQPLSMLNVGEPLPYESYGYKIPINCGSKQLFNFNTLEYGHRIQWTTGNEYADANARMSDFIKVKEGHTYSLSSVAFVIGYDENYNYIGVYNSETGSLRKEAPSARNTRITIPLNSNCSYIKLITKENPQIGEEFMLNEGQTVLPYEDYIEPAQKNIYLNEPLHKIDNYADILSYSEHNVVRKIKKLVLTGQETGLNRSWTGGRSIFYLDTITPDYLRSNDITLLCSHYKAIAGVTEARYVREGETALFKTVGVNQRLYFGDSNYSVVDDFKTYLAQQYAAGTPVTIWYVLETPETEQIKAPDILADKYTSITVDTEVQPSQVDFSTKGKKVPQPSRETVRMLNSVNKANQVNAINSIDMLNQSEELMTSEAEPDNLIEETKEEEPIEKEQTKEVEPIEKTDEKEITKK